MMHEEVKKVSVARLQKIEGQVRGIKKMIENDKYCIDIINQITAAQNALAGVSKIIMKRHVEECITNAINKGQGHDMINEMIDTVYRVSK
jgi:DNA-binding FrmR family transcriptional regulator